MYHTLKETAQCCGLNERTVIGYMQQYMQTTGSLHAAPTAERREWRFTDEDIVALQRIKAERATRRAPPLHAALHAEYMQSTDSSAVTDAKTSAAILPRLEQLEEQVRTLTRRVEALVLLRPSAASTERPTPVPVAPLPAAPLRPVTVKSATHVPKPGRLPRPPTGYWHVNAWADKHNISHSNAKRYIIEQKQAPTVDGEWRENGPIIKHLLGPEGQAAAHALWRLPDPCTRCGWSSAATAATPTQDNAPVGDSVSLPGRQEQEQEQDEDLDIEAEAEAEA